MVSASGGAANTKYVHANHLYSPAALTDNTGAVVERYKYDAYGKRTIYDAAGTVVRTASSYGFPVTFTGRYEDKETGLLYFRARYYSTSQGRFVGRDDLPKPKRRPEALGGYADGFNLYSAYFSPNELDPTGEAVLTINVKKDSQSPPNGPRVNPNLWAEYKKGECCCKEIYWRQIVSSREVWWRKERGAIWGYGEGYFETEDGTWKLDGGERYPYQSERNMGKVIRNELEDRPGRDELEVVNWFPKYRLNRVVLIAQDFISLLICKRHDGSENALVSVTWGHLWMRENMDPYGQISWSVYPDARKQIPFYCGPPEPSVPTPSGSPSWPFR